MSRDPVVIAAIITVGGMLVTIVLNLLFNFLQRKAEFDERLFFNIYQKRLEVYEEVIKTMSEMGNPDACFDIKSKQEFADKATIAFHTLCTLAGRLRVYGSIGARKIIVESSSVMKEMCIEPADRPFFSDKIMASSAAAGVEPLAYVIDTFLNAVDFHLARFTKFIREEEGSNFLDKRLGKIKKKLRGKKTKKKP